MEGTQAPGALTWLDLRSLLLSCVPGDQSLSPCASASLQGLGMEEGWAGCKGVIQMWETSL